MDKKIVAENYENIREFLDVLQSRKNTKKAGDSTKRSDPDFFGFSFEESLERVYTGIEKTVERMKKIEINGDSLPVNPRPRKRRDYVGYAPNVPAYLEGRPKTMYRMVRTPQKVKTLNLIYNACVNCDIEGNTLNKAGTTFFALAYNLEKMGYRVKITVIPFCAGNDGETAVCTISLKDYKDSFDIQKLSFPLASVSMFRRLGFAWIERVPLETLWGSSKGTSYTNKEKQKEVLKASGYNLKDAVLINVNDCRSVNYDVNALVNEVLKERQGN